MYKTLNDVEHGVESHIHECGGCGSDSREVVDGREYWMAMCRRESVKTCPFDDTRCVLHCVDVDDGAVCYKISGYWEKAPLVALGMIVDAVARIEGGR